jgi:hypothetical protein
MQSEAAGSCCNNKSEEEEMIGMRGLVETGSIELLQKYTLAELKRILWS